MEIRESDPGSVAYGQLRGFFGNQRGLFGTNKKGTSHLEQNEMKNKISITLGTLDSGWLPVVFHYKDFQLDFHASNVINDPVDELIYAANKLQDNETKRITFWLGASAYYFDMTRNGDIYRLTVSYSDDLFDEAAEPIIMQTIQGHEDEIIKPLRLAVAAFVMPDYDRQP